MRAGILAMKDGTAMELRDEAGRKRMVLHVDVDGPILSLMDEAGKVRTGFKVTKNEPIVSILDEEGTPRVVLSDWPSLTLQDNQGYLATLGVTELITPTTGTTTKRSAASLVLFDKDKHAIWQAP